MLESWTLAALTAQAAEKNDCRYLTESIVSLSWEGVCLSQGCVVLLTLVQFTVYPL